MKFKFLTCYTEMQRKKLMASGFTIHVNVRKLQISLRGFVSFLLYPTLFLLGNLIIKFYRDTRTLVDETVWKTMFNVFYILACAGLHV